MADYPFLSIEVRAYLSDTMHLSSQEHGAYLLLLMAAWLRADCRLPDDDVFLARTARMTTRAWKPIRSTVMAFWTLDDEGYWLQKRLREERTRISDTSKQRKGAANTRWLKNNETADANASVVHMRESMQNDAIHNHNHNHNQKGSPPPSGIEANRIDPLSGQRGVQGGDGGQPRCLADPPAPRKAASPRRRAVPPDWRPAERTVERLRERFPTLDWEAELPSFIDHHAMRGNTFADLEAAFRTWCGYAMTRFGGRSATHRPADPPAPEPPWASVDEATWDYLVAAYFGHERGRTRGDWPEGYGPTPEQPGCHAPPSLIARHRTSSQGAGR